MFAPLVIPCILCLFWRTHLLPLFGCHCLEIKLGLLLRQKFALKLLMAVSHFILIENYVLIQSIFEITSVPKTLRLQGLYPVCHLLVQLLQSAKLQIILLCKIGIYDRDIITLFFPFLPLFLCRILLLSLLRIKDSLLLLEIPYQSLAILLCQQAEVEVDHIDYKKFDVGLHSYLVDQLLPPRFHFGVVTVV